jgi:cyclopropane fatty-acyl-phospholipid synthase-like methyltransferase
VSWDRTYICEKKVWGDQPSKLAMFVYNFLAQSTQFRDKKDIFVLDLGCGYGRDAIFLANNLPCHVLGIDNSGKAIEMARESLSQEMVKRVELLCYDFSRVNDRYDIILASSLYQILKPEDRDKLRETVKRCLKSDGLLFLSTLSIHDPQHFGQGTPIENDPNSFQQEKYIHFSTREELEKDFDFLNISALFEREYHEPRSSGVDHHHISWILIGGMK